jgi:hypothetical protein
MLLLSFSTLSLKAELVNINFIDKGEIVYTKTDAVAGTTYNLASVISAAGKTPTACRGSEYTFYGWKVGSPVEGDETPVVATTVTPQANVNVYAVYEKAAASLNRFVRITTLEDLEAEKEYLIVCYHTYGGEPQYYALANTDSSYTYNNNSYHSIPARRLDPVNGVITEPDENLIWTLKTGNTAGTWKWWNMAARSSSRELCIDNNATRYMTYSAGNGSTSCSITVASGIYTISSGSYYLKYVDDAITEDEDYFITGTSMNDYAIYLYKKESPYTSYPDCSEWTVHLDAVDGVIAGSSNHKADSTEATAGGGVTLPSAAMSGGSCGDWSFAGWHIDAPVDGTTTMPTLHAAGSYDPLYNGMTMYAVYQKAASVSYYKLVSSLTTGKKYIITNYSKTKAISTAYTGSGSVWPMVSVTANASDEINNPSDEVIWTWTGSYFQDDEGNKLSYGRYNGLYFTSVSSSPSYLRYYYSQDGYYWYLYEANGNKTNEYGYSRNSGSYPSEYNEFKFYFFEEKTRVTATYSSYPHCTDYSVTLHGCGGTIGGESNVELTETTPGGGIVLPSAVPTCGGNWTFVGWFLDEDKASFEHVEFTDFKAAGSTYYPKYDGTHLYAIYKRPTNKFRIMYYVDDMVAGDNYLITKYAKDAENINTYDWEISATTYSNNYLSSVKGEAPQGSDGYYMEEDDSLQIWRMTGTYSSCTFQNLKTGKYLTSTSDGYTRTGDYSTSYRFNRESSGGGFSFSMYDIYNERYMTYNTENGYFRTTSSSSAGMFVYRQVKEYTSWPHCDPFVVSFDACGGTADDGTLTESEPYAGVTLPEAYANSDCSKEGWAFAGWATEPVNEETDVLTFDLLAPGTVYHPLATSTMLYAVYFRKTNQYKRIATLARLHTGVNYIITTADNKALTNINASGSTITAQTVTPGASGIIVTDNDSINWRLDGVSNEYQIYNVSRDVYLDLRNAKAQLNKSNAVAKQDNFLISYEDGYIIRSNLSLVAYDEDKYLGYSSSSFTAVDEEDDSRVLYFYRQQASYNSRPNCVEDIDAIKWAKVDGTFNSVTLESYHLTGAPNVNNASGSPERQEDGSWVVKFNNSIIEPFTETAVHWGGTDAMLKIPYIVSDNVNTSSFLTASSDCSDCDVYVMPGKTLTVNATDTIHTITVPDGATLNVANGNTLTVNSLVLFIEGDQTAPYVNLNTSGSIVLKNGELYHDRRIDENRYYWLTLPFNAKLKEISYSNVAANGKIPAYRTDYWLKYYNGSKRAADAESGGVMQSSYWAHVAAKGADYTIVAGQGYNLGIANQSTIYYAGQDYTHTKRILRFTMRPDKTTWLTQERTGGTKTTPVTPSTVTDVSRANHAGWNLIGNPYMHTYNTGTVPTDGKIRNGAWKKELNGNGDWTGHWIEDDTRATDVPYITIYNPAASYGNHYTQILASNQELKPFEAVFVQISEGSQINFMPSMNIPASVKARITLTQEDLPIRTGIILSGNEQSDRTGVVLSDEYTTAYEIGADLAKMTNSGALNLYTINANNHKLAFNGLSDNDAEAPIPVGVTFPADGEYTFAFDAEQYSLNDVDTLQLIDSAAHTITDLRYATYAFTAQKGEVNNRFYLLVRRAQAPQIATDLDELDNTSSSVRKVIINGHLFILKEDEMYNALGTRIR